MNTETLLIPRYKIIANYFHSPYEIGDYLENVTDFRFVVTKHCNIQSLASVETLDKMTYLFKKLERGRPQEYECNGFFNVNRYKCWITGESSVLE